MRFGLCLVLAACGADSASAPAPAPPAPALPAVSKAPPPLLTGAHGAEITALGVAPDGHAIASADRHGGMRLWTALDGTREPVVIRGTAARAIALARDGDGFAIGTLDAAGGAHVIQTTASGAVRGRAAVAGEQPATEIAATAEGLLILRADQTVELVDARGTVRSRLTPEPGTHVDSLVARGNRVLALVREDKHLVGRWILVDRGAHWGSTTPRLPFQIDHAVLSPEGDLLAVSRPRSLHPALIDLATGKALKAPLCVTKQWTREMGDEEIATSELLRNNNAPLPLGFLTNRIVACSVMTTVVWWSTDGTRHANAAGSFTVAGLPVAIANALVIGTASTLALVTPDAIRFLGYSVHNLVSLRAAPGGLLIGAAEQQSLVLDGNLRERARFEISRGQSNWLDVLAIDDRYAIAAALRRSSDGGDAGAQLAVYDGLARTVHQLLPYAARDKEMSYEPSTRLLSTTDGQTAVLVRFDPVTHTFGEAIRVGAGLGRNRLMVIDPRLSGGIAALQINEVSDGLLVVEIPDSDLNSGTTVQPRNSYRVAGELRAIDRAGHLYMHSADDHDDIVVYTRDIATARLPGVARMLLKPSADGSRIAAFQSPRLVMLGATGQTRWDSAQWSGSELDWTSAGELVMQFPTGIAKIDLETGGLSDRHCGWGFGLSEQLSGASGGGPSICDAER